MRRPWVVGPVVGFLLAVALRWGAAYWWVDEPTPAVPALPTATSQTQAPLAPSGETVALPAAGAQHRPRTALMEALAAQADGGL